MQSNEIFDLAVVGGGPGGYVCAIRASQLGLRVALIEKKNTLGGTCINVGCIPSKALLDSSHKYSEAKSSLLEHGIKIKDVQLDLIEMMKRKTNLVKELTDGIDYLIKKNKITRFLGTGSFQRNNSEVVLSLAMSDGDGNGPKKNENTKEIIRAKNYVIATGSQVIELPNIKFDGVNIISSDHAISLTQVPKNMVIIGGGVIGLELGSVWSRLGSDVTIVEALPSILLSLDKQMRDQVLRSLNKQGLKFLFEHKLIEAVSIKKAVEISLENKEGKKIKLEADKLLIAVGRKPCIESLSCESVGVEINNRGRIVVDPKSFQTSVSNIFAIGDVIEGPMLAHKASEEGVFLAEKIAGKHSHINYKSMPWIVYTWPEVAWVGSTQEELDKAGVEYNIGKYMFKPNARAKAMNESEGMVKIFASKYDDTILGAFIFGPNASELIAEFALAIEFGASSEDLARTFHAHPTLSEVAKEAALDVLGGAIHA